MRFLTTLSLVMVLCNVQAQRPGIATLLSLADCLDTTCISARLRTVDYCLKGGKKEDGWKWSRCGAFDQWGDQHVVRFKGSENGHYRDYFITTRDTALADTLTYELHRLGFTMERQYHERQRFVKHFMNNAYPGLEVLRLERRASNIRYMKSGDLADPHALPMDSLGCDATERLQKMAQEAGYDGFEMIQELHWGFRVRVPTPQLTIRPGLSLGTVDMFYPVSDQAVEFTVRDLSGKEVLRSVTKDQRTVIDVSGLNNGVHYLTIYSKTGMVSKTFMKN